MSQSKSSAPIPPLWSSAFRPFYLLGALFAPLLAAVWLAAWLGAPDMPASGMPLRLWHGHEMLFGFSAAIIMGIALTALPSWAGTEEIQGAPLALLVALWLVGRIAFWLSPRLPPVLAGAVDCALFPAAALLVAPQLLRAANKLYLLLLPIFAALFAANGIFHAGLAAGNEALASLGLRLALYAIIFLYVLKGGVLTPIFTGNVLREKGRGDQARFRLGIEVPAAAVVPLLAALDLGGAPPLWTGLAALAAAALHGVRMVRWKGWRAADVPLVFVMHLGFAWLVFAFALRAAEAAALVAAGAWVHAFTVGGLGMMMLGLMTRVTLRHTGRPLAVPREMLAAYALMFAAALLRLAATVHGLGNWAVASAAVLWAVPFLIYLALFGVRLVRPSLPRQETTGRGSSSQ